MSMDPRWTELLGESVALRRTLGLDHLGAYRLVHARKAREGDLARPAPPRQPEEGLIIDRYGSAVVITTFNTGFDVDALLEELGHLDGVSAWYLQARQPDLGQLVAPTLVAGIAPGAQIVEEGALRYGVDVERGLNPGLILDTRVVRRRLTGSALRGMRVLNLFSYTCTMGLAALAGGALSVVNVDSSRSSLARGKQNYGHNSRPVDERDFIKDDVFKQLSEMRKRGVVFDAVICDPPPRLPGRGDALFQYGNLLDRIRPVHTGQGPLVVVTRDIRLENEDLRTLFGPAVEILSPDGDVHPPGATASLFRAAWVPPA